MSCSPFSMELDLSAKDFSDCNWEDWQDILPSYLRTFLNYARDNQQRLTKLLEGHVHQAIYDHSDFLHEDCARTLGILTALNTFIEGFIACYTSEERLSSSEQEQFIAWLTAFLDHVSWKAEDGPEIVGRFTTIARTLINNRTLTTAPLNTEKTARFTMMKPLLPSRAMPSAPSALG